MLLQFSKKTAGPSWFDLPAPSEAELPRLYHEVEALRLRNQLDPKRFYRKDAGEGKGIKGLPKYFSVRQRPSGWAHLTLNLCKNRLARLYLLRLHLAQPAPITFPNHVGREQ